jgi:hypothetical protein
MNFILDKHLPCFGDIGILMSSGQIEMPMKGAVENKNFSVRMDVFWVVAAM